VVTELLGSVFNIKKSLTNDLQCAASKPMCRTSDVLCLPHLFNPAAKDESCLLSYLRMMSHDYVKIQTPTFISLSAFDVTPK
jgi:hypothetical protein